MTKTETPVEVQALRRALDEAEIDWVPLRDYPDGTYLPETYNGIWWRPEHGGFIWGHQFEFTDPDPAAVLARLKES